MPQIWNSLQSRRQCQNTSIRIQLIPFVPANSSANVFNLSTITLNPFFDINKAQLALAHILGKSALASSLNWNTYETLLHMQQAYFDSQYNVVTATDITTYVTEFLVLAAVLYGISYLIYRRFLRQMFSRQMARRNRDIPPRPATRTPHQLMRITPSPLLPRLHRTHPLR